MKLKKLTIHNIASIEDAVIDFEHGPLAEDSRFLICGPTGAGKTTLLDAISLALYGTTPRLNGAEKEHYVDPDEKFSKTKNDEAFIYDPRMLMRRGSFSASVELFFTDKDDKDLKAVWSCSRAYNKADGSIKVPEWILLDASDDSVICSKKTEVQTMIIERIGLTFDQFCRTTLLAQGDFTKFLKSDEDQKSEILEKLTGTGIYSEISKQIHVLKGEKEAACEEVKAQLGGVQLLSDEDRANIDLQQKELANRIKQLSDEEQQLTSVLLWFTQLDHLMTEQKQATGYFLHCEEQVQTDSYREESSLLDDWDRTASQREAWKVRSQANMSLAEAIKEEGRLQTTYLDLSAGLACLQQTVKEKQQTRQKAIDYLSAEEPKVECYRQIALIDSYHQQRLQASNQIKRSQSVVLTRNAELKGLQEDLVKQNQQVETQRKLITHKQEELASVTIKMDALNYPDLLDQRNQLDKQLDELKNFHSLVEQTVQLHSSTVEKQEILQAIQTQLKDVTVKKEKAEQVEAELQERLHKQEQIYENQKLTCDNMMKEYRSHLVEGEICPLCGQRIEHLTSDEHFVSLLKPVKDEVDSLNKQWKEAGKAAAELKAQYTSLLRDEVLKQKEWTKAKELEDQNIAVKEKHALFARFDKSEDSLADSEQGIKDIQLQLEQLHLKLKEVGTLQKDLASLQREKNSLDVSLRQVEKKVTEMEKRITQTTDAIKAEQSLLDSNSQLIEEMNDKLAKYLDMELYQQRGEDYLSALKKGASLYQKATDKLQLIEKELQRLTAEEEHVLQIKSIIDEKRPLWKELSVPGAVFGDNLSAEWVRLQTALSMNEATQKEARQRIDEAGQALADYFVDEQSVTEERLVTLVNYAANDIEKLRKSHQELREKLAGAKSAMETIQQNYQQHLTNRPPMEENVTREQIQGKLQEVKESSNLLHQQYGQLLQHKATDDENKQRFSAITQKLEVLTKEAERWGHLHALFGSADGKKFRNIAQSYVLEQLLHSANRYLCQFTKRYEMECQPGSLTILLRDKEAGGVIRPTSTISGGESFLISLSLALGLSSLSRASVSMDTLFIDEGFGTLDGSYLSAVMDALERLHQMGGKKIGIISHVESLKERLTTQIQVTRVNNTLSTVSVVSL